jgi:hypothetical protein
MGTTRESRIHAREISKSKTIKDVKGDLVGFLFFQIKLVRTT